MIKMGALDVIVVILLIVLLGIGGYVFWDNLPGKVEDFKPAGNVDGKNSQVYSNGSQFYPNMRYPDKEISYSLSDSCDDNKKSSAREAFSIISRKTILNFKEKSGSAEIEILCSDISPTAEEKGHFVAGEGGPKDIFVSGPYYVITTGKVSLYRDDKCDAPQIATHEILHALGFDHNDNPESIMYPVTGCDEKIDDYIINEINRLYSIKSASDLVIVSANGQKSGKYVSFVVDVSNYGFIDALSVNLTLSNKNEKIKEFDLKSIPFGNSKKITVDNVVVPRDTTELNFKAYLTDNADEISLDNNEAVLKING